MEAQELRDCIYTEGMLLQARIKLEGMVAENKQAEFDGNNLPYIEKDFINLINEYGVHHNAILANLWSFSR